MPKPPPNIQNLLKIYDAWNKGWAEYSAALSAEQKAEFAADLEELRDKFQHECNKICGGVGLKS